MTGEAPLNSQSYLLDKETIEVIAKTAQRVDHLAEMMTSTAQKLDRIGDAVGGLKTDVAVCLMQDKDIADLKEDVDKLKESANKTAGKLAGVAFVVTLIANYLAPIMPALFGVKS